MNDKKLVSIIVPAFNEEKSIPVFLQELQKILVTLNHQYSFEIIFINDGSTDKTKDVLGNLSSKDQNVKFLEFSRNFGKEIAISAGLHYAKGNAAIIIDADLQHPVELIPSFLQKWEHGADMVIGVRTKTKERNLLRKMGSYFFYKILNLIGDIQVVPNATDFRLVDRKVLDEFKRFTERNRITRGLLDWLGFNKEYIEFTANERKFGRSVYSKLKLLKLAFSTFVGHSLFPLKMAGYVGMVITLLSGILGLAIIVGKYIFKIKYFMSFTGPAQLAILIVFLVGIILMALGIIALYIGNIHGEVVNRPIYIVKKKKNFS